MSAGTAAPKLALLQPWAAMLKPVVMFRPAVMHQPRAVMLRPAMMLQSRVVGKLAQVATRV